MTSAQHPEHIILIGGHHKNDLPAVQGMCRVLASKPGATVRLRRSNLWFDGTCTFEVWVWGFSESEWHEVQEAYSLERWDLVAASPGNLDQ